MSDFAKAQLQKYGWTEGKGLGKNENGISQAIRPKLKFDTSGVGHKDSDYEWWSSVYDKAASNIVLEKKPDTVSISVADKDAVNISSKNAAAFAKATLYHGKFLKTSTLQDGNLVRDSACQSLEDNEEKTSGDPSIPLTDEELFKACGGRTAHKGARHGLTLSGKLKRIAEQERQLLANGGLKSCKKSMQGHLRDSQKIKKSNAAESDIPPLDVEENDDLVLPVPPVYNDENRKLSKKTIRKNKRSVQDLVNQLNKTCKLQDDSAAVYDEENSPQDTSEDSSKWRNKKRKKSKRKRDQGPETNDSDTSAACLLDDDVSMEPSAKKRRAKPKVSLSKKTCDCPADNSRTCTVCYEQKVYDKYCTRVVAASLKGKKSHKKKYNKESPTAWEAEKLNRRIGKRKNNKIQKKEKKKKAKNIVLPARLTLEPTSA